MSNNIENERSLTAGKMYPIDLAPQKITIVKSMPNTEVKMAHLISGQPKTTNASQIITHTGIGSMGVMRTATPIITPGVTSQPPSGSPIIHATQIVSQGSSQILGQGSQVINQTQILPSGQLLSPNTQIISQGSQLSAQVSTNNNAQVSNGSSLSNTILNVGGGLASAAGNLVVSSSVRTLPPSVRVLPPLPHHNNKPVLTSATNTGGVLVNKTVTSHVPRGLAAGASLAVRPVVNAVPSGAQGGAWSNRGARGALVYGSRARSPALRAAAPHAVAPATTVLTSSSVISSTVRSPAPPAPATRPLPLLQRNYQPTKVVNVANVGLRGVVGNSAPPQLYYEVPRAPPAAHPAPLQLPRLLTPYSHAPTTQVSVVSTTPAPAQTEARPPLITAPPRPTILRKRDVDGSPTKALPLTSGGGGSGWEDVPRGGGAGSGSTTVSAASSPAPDDEPRADLSPRKKPRKQILSNEVRQCEFPPESKSPTPPPPPPPVPPPKRPSLRGTFVCGWRGTALHFTRPAEVVRRECRRDLAAIAAQRHVLTSAEGWKVHHLTAQMDDLVSLEADVGEQLTVVLQSLESSSGRGHATLKPLSHTLLELIKGNIQRSKIVCEGIQEAREDILRVFKHRNFVSEILTRQSEKRCFRKHRSMS